MEQHEEMQGKVARGEEKHEETEVGVDRPNPTGAGVRAIGITDSTEGGEEGGGTGTAGEGAGGEAARSLAGEGASRRGESRGTTRWGGGGG